MVRVAAVQAEYVLMNAAATLDRVAQRTTEAAAKGAQLVAFPSPRTPVVIESSATDDDVPARLG